MWCSHPGYIASLALRTGDLLRHGLRLGLGFVLALAGRAAEMKTIFCTMMMLMFSAGVYAEAQGDTGLAISGVVLAVLWGVGFLCSDA